MTQIRSSRLSTFSWTLSLAILILISVVTAWHLARNLPFETLSSPGDLLSLILGAVLAASVLVAGSFADSRMRLNYLAIAASILALATVEYVLDVHPLDAIDPLVALAWGTLGICLLLRRVAGPISRSARLCLAIGISIEAIELLRSIVVATVYGSATQPPSFQWFESEADLLLRTAYIIGVIEIMYFQVMNLPATENAVWPSRIEDKFKHFWRSPSLNPILALNRDQRDAQFRARNPGADFGQFYASRVIRKLNAGHGHPTLGVRRRVFKLPFSREPVRAEEFREKGLGHFETVLRAGLRPEHICVDYGCGSLRVGQHLIQFLNPANYWGLDVVDRFFTDGFELLPLELKTKAPNLRVITPAALAETAQAYPDFVVCFAVLTHVPPDELEAVLDRILSLTSGKSVLVLSFYEAESFIRRGQVSFTHRTQQIDELILARRPGATLQRRRRERPNKRTMEWEVYLEVRFTPAIS